jgi:hypothetical protein
MSAISNSENFRNNLCDCLRDGKNIVNKCALALAVIATVGLVVSILALTNTLHITAGGVAFTATSIPFYTILATGLYLSVYSVTKIARCCLKPNQGVLESSEINSQDRTEFGDSHGDEDREIPQGVRGENHQGDVTHTVNDGLND